MAPKLWTSVLILCAIVTPGLCFVDATTTEERFAALSSRLEQVEGEVVALRSQPCNCANISKTTPVAFHAVLSRTLENLGAHQQIVFDSVLTNVGNAYNAQHGFFKAPIKGVYAFFVTVTNIPQHTTSVVLKKNGQTIGNVLAHGSSANPSLYVTSTIAATSILEAGDEVWVQNEYDNGIEEIDGGWSYFTGHIVAEM